MEMYRQREFAKTAFSSFGCNFVHFWPLVIVVPDVQLSPSGRMARAI